MGYDIGPLREDEVEALSRFLIKGFGVAPEALFAAPDVLRWKFVTPRGAADEVLPRALVARDAAGGIVGHVGWVGTRFCSGTPAASVVAGIHMIDWLGSPEHKGVGGALLRRVNALAPVQYGFGGTSAGRAVVKGAGFVPRPPVPVFQCVLRPGYAFRADVGVPYWKRAGRALRDSGLIFARRVEGGPGTASFGLKRVERFDGELETLQMADLAGQVASRKGCADWNALLAFPRGGISGWVIERRGATVGFALLSVVSNPRTRVGKVVDLVMSKGDECDRGVAYALLRGELERQGADLALVCGATEVERAGLRAAGFRRAFELELSVRDRAGLLPPEVPIHVSFLDADYAFLP